MTSDAAVSTVQDQSLFPIQWGVVRLGLVSGELRIEAVESDDALSLDFVALSYELIGHLGDTFYQRLCRRIEGGSFLVVAAFRQAGFDLDSLHAKLLALVSDEPTARVNATTDVYLLRLAEARSLVAREMDQGQKTESADHGGFMPDDPAVAVAMLRGSKLSSTTLRAIAEEAAAGLAAARADLELQLRSLQGTSPTVDEAQQIATDLERRCQALSCVLALPDGRHVRLRGATATHWEFAAADGAPGVERFERFPGGVSLSGDIGEALPEVTAGGATTPNWRVDADSLATDPAGAKRFLQDVGRPETFPTGMLNRALVQAALQAVSGQPFASHEELTQLVQGLQVLGKFGYRFQLAKDCGRWPVGTQVTLTSEPPEAKRPCGRMHAAPVGTKGHPGKATRFIPLQLVPEAE